MELDFSTIAGLIVSPSFITVWCSLIALYSCYWAASLLTKSRCLAKQLDSAMLILKVPKNSEQFADNLQGTESQLMLHPDLAPSIVSLYSHFQMSTRKSIGNGQRIIESAIDPGELFNEQTIIDQKIDQKTYSAISGQLSRIGILGTFVGLSAGIYLARGALAGTDTTEMQSALTQLLGGAALDFWTSIVGVLSSIAFSRIENAALYRLRQKIQEIVKLFNSMIIIRTAENNSAFQNEVLLEQTQCLREISEQMSKLHRGQAQIQTQALTDIVTQFRTALFGQAPQEMKAIATGCEEILNVIREGIGGLGQSSQSLLSSCQNAGRVLEESLSKAADEFRRKLLETNTLIETAAKSSADEISVSMIESSLYVAEQLKTSASTMAVVIDNLNDKTRKATDDWTDAILTVERVANLMQSTLTRTGGRQTLSEQDMDNNSHQNISAGYLESKRTTNTIIKRKTI